MGFRAAQWSYSLKADNLTTTQLCLLRQAAWSCLDDSGKLDRSRTWLGDKCRVSPRSLERHLPILDKLGLLVWNGQEFRLPAYLLAAGIVVADRQIGGEAPASTAILSANLSANLAVAAKEKESIKEKENANECRERREGGSARAPAREFEAAEAFNQAREHYHRFCGDFGWRADTPDLDWRILAALRMIGDWPRIAALRDNPRDLAFAMKDFIRFYLSAPSAIESALKPERSPP